ncbi:MAG TPA: glycosyltransferase family 1 protein [Coleofasciculaceae cyanobacterium]
MDKTIVQIVPRIPPHTDGVGDYSLKLAEQLLKDYRINTHFLVFKKDIEIESLVNGFSATLLSTHTPEFFLSVLPQTIDTILLHYSNYPYLSGKLDAPFWLVRGLELAMKLRQIKLVVMFHELPMLKYKKINVLNPIQSIVSRRLAKLASTVITDSARFQAILSQWIKRPIPCIPDFSTIGEPHKIKSLAERKRRIIVFGTTDRNRVYANYLSELLFTCSSLGIEEIYDIGKPLNLRLSDFKKMQVVEMGFQPSDVVSQLMLDSMAGFFDYSRFPGDLGKSTVFAAFCAHGLIPIISQYNPSEADGLEMNQHYLVPGESLQNFSLSQLQTIADKAHNWYKGHSLPENAKVFAASILG